MALKVTWTEIAWSDLENVADYIGRDSRHYAAADVEINTSVLNIEQAVEKILENI